ncbi:MAG TPA: FdrA family protein [Actinomycetes bacterium]|nr:FdrA family protein [Actinomycetes bacterium]
MHDRVEVRRGTYHDSVTLMQVSRQAEGLPGVQAAAAVVATPVNLELLARQGFTVDPDGLGPNDLVICIRAEGEEAADQAVERVGQLLAGAGPAGGGGGSGPAAVAPRSVRSAARRDPDLNLAVLSVPGRHLAYEAAQALQAGLHVFCFSDGLDLATEAAFKRAAAERGLLFMGADCGTAILDGVGLGFANAVRRGPVGVVGASGTGIQEVTCLLDAAGVGVSQAVGVGGRDLSPEVGGTMTVQALELLAGDDATERLVVVSKPPDPEVARRVADAAAATGKPVVLTFPGMGSPPPLPAGVAFAGSLEAAAAWAVASPGAPPPAEGGGATRPATRPVDRADGPGLAGDRSVAAPASWESSASLPAVTPGDIRGLFSGGTLCYEAMAVVAGVVGRVASNIPLRPEWRLADPHRSEGHTFVDFGDDAMTEGRAHPMIDPSLRNERFRREAADPGTGVVLLDVVLGYGAHPDPAGELAPLIQQALAGRPGDLTVVVSLCGAAADPQGLDGQAAALRDAGAAVTRSCAAAARLALAAAGLAGPKAPGAVAADLRRAPLPGGLDRLSFRPGPGPGGPGAGLGRPRRPSGSDDQAGEAP